MCYIRNNNSNTIGTNNTDNIDALTAQITKQGHGLCASIWKASKPAAGDGTGETRDGDQIFETQLGQISGILPKCADIGVNNSISSTASSNNGGNQFSMNEKFVSSRIPLHATVSLKKKEKKNLVRRFYWFIHPTGR